MKKILISVLFIPLQLLSAEDSARIESLELYRPGRNERVKVLLSYDNQGQPVTISQTDAAGVTTNRKVIRYANGCLNDARAELPADNSFSLTFFRGKDCRPLTAISYAKDGKIDQVLFFLYENDRLKTIDQYDQTGKFTGKIEILEYSADNRPAKVRMSLENGTAMGMDYIYSSDKNLQKIETHMMIEGARKVVGIMEFRYSKTLKASFRWEIEHLLLFG